MDHHDSSYEWNYQGSMRHQIRMDQHPESNAFYGRNSLISKQTIHVTKISKNQFFTSPTFTNLQLVDIINYPYILNDLPDLAANFFPNYRFYSA